jgi:hypothetical protein
MKKEPPHSVGHLLRATLTTLQTLALALGLLAGLAATAVRAAPAASEEVIVNQSFTITKTYHEPFTEVEVARASLRL